jgi:hypothetical protein
MLLFYRGKTTRKTHGKGGTVMQKTKLNINNAGAQVIKAPNAAENKGKEPKKTTGGDLRAR